MPACSGHFIGAADQEYTMLLQAGRRRCGPEASYDVDHELERRALVPDVERCNARASGRHPQAGP
jgi:hypothetical protein